MTMINGLYGKKYTNLRNKLWEEGYKKGKIGEQDYMTPTVVAWLDKATEVYWRQRVEGILAQIGTRSDADVLSQ